MGTRLTPGRFDCHDAALDDEPRFTLLARDPLAGFLVSIWSSVRFGDFEAAGVKYRTMIDRVGEDYAISPDIAQGSDAIECAYRWRTPEPRTPSATEAALDAAVMALRSYQHGNAAPDLAAEIADAGEQALRDAGIVPTMATRPEERR